MTTEYEAELTEAAGKSDIVSKLKVSCTAYGIAHYGLWWMINRCCSYFSCAKVWTIKFTEQYGFIGILLLASWPNAAFDMCGMACGWLEMPFWTFFGATLVGKAFVKVREFGRSALHVHVLVQAARLVRIMGASLASLAGPARLVPPC